MRNLSESAINKSSDFNSSSVATALVSGAYAMPQRMNPRKGRQYENVAREILFEFCFLAQPITIADDVGVDFFCTLFEPRQVGGDAELIPQVSFWIQIKGKSRAKTIDLTKILPMLRVVQAPFFIGTIDHANRKLDIFSGHYLIPLLAYKGSVNIKKLRAKLCDATAITGLDNDYFEETSPGEYVLCFPKVTEIAANPDKTALAQTRELMLVSCSRMLQNIASGILEEHTFENHDGKNTLLFSGIGSLQSYEPNLFKRLGEVFFSLHNAYRFAQWQPEVRPQFDVYEKIYLELAAAYGPGHELLSYVKAQYDGAKNAIKGTK